MKQTVNFTDFHDAFRAQDRLGNFSYHGLEVLFDYFEQYEDETGTEIELDVIAICCEFSEDHWEDIANNYSVDLEDCEDEVERITKVRDYLEYNTLLVGMSDSATFIYQAF